MSFYDEMMPLVQTMPQILFHKEKIFSELLHRVNMKAQLSLEPILMYVQFQTVYLVLVSLKLLLLPIFDASYISNLSNS